MKQVVIFGLGSFGYHTALALINHENQVLVIDNDRDKIQDIKDKVTNAVFADVKDKTSLTKLVDKNIDIAIISLGHEMEASILVVLYLKELGIKKILAKVNSEDEAKILKLVGATNIIFPERDMALKTAANLTNPNIIDYLPLSEGYSIIEFAVPEIFIDKSMKELNMRNQYKIEVIAVKNKKTNSVDVIPSPNYHFKKGDSLIIVGEDERITALKKL